MALGCRGHAFPDLKVHAFAKDFKDSERSDGLARCGGNTLLQKEKSGSVTQFTYDHGCDTQAWLNHFINNISYLAHNLSWASVRSILTKKPYAQCFMVRRYIWGTFASTRRKSVYCIF